MRWVAAIVAHAALEPVEGRVERPLWHLDDVGRDLSDPFRDGPSVLRLEGEGAEDQQVQRALWQIDACGGHVGALLRLREA